MKRVLVLEDDPNRMELIWKLTEGHDVHWIKSSADPIDSAYDIYLLDHDLGGRQMEEHEDSGTAFAQKHREQLMGGHVLVHSYNYPAAMRMLEILGHGTYGPFGGSTWQWQLNRILSA